MATYELIIDNARMDVHCHEPGPLFIDVDLTRGRHVDYLDDGTNVDEFLDFPIDYPFEFKWTRYPDPTYNHITGTYLYPVQWGGHDSSGTDFVPGTPNGYSFQEIRTIIKGYRTGEDEDTITADTSGWGYDPPPEKSPWLETIAGVPVALDAFTHEESADIIVAGAGWTFDNEQFQSALHINKWYPSGPGSPPYAAEDRTIVVDYVGLRFFFNPV